MNASRSPIDAAYTSLDTFASGNMVLGQKFTEGNSGLMTWLRTYESGPSSSSPQPRLLVERIGLFPSSGEIRCAVRSPIAVLEHLWSLYADKALDAEEKGGSGLNLTFAEWRFRIRLSESQLEILLNVESRGDVVLMQLKTAELLAQIDEKNRSES